MSDVAGAGERRRVRRVLLGAPVQQVLADVEDERGDRQDRHEPAGEDDEDLAALAAASRQLLMTRVDAPLTVIGGIGTSGITEWKS